MSDGGEKTGAAAPLHVGRRSSVWQTRITNAEGKLLALVIQTQMTIQGWGAVASFSPCGTVA